VDLNHDGFDDVVLQSYQSQVFLSTGDGSFESRTIGNIGGGSGLALADFDLDGNLDAATSSLSRWGMPRALGRLSSSRVRRRRKRAGRG